MKDIEQAGLPVGCVMPALLRVEPGRYDEVATVIRKEMTRGLCDFQLSALRGLVFWVDADRERPSRHPLPSPPSDLIRELGAAVAMRHAGDLRLLLNGACAVLKRPVGASDHQFVKSILIGLDYLFTETQYRDRKGDADTIPYKVIPAVRRECVRIARRLSDCGHSSDLRVQRWLEAANDDPLPKVRAASRSSDPENDDD